MTTEDQIDELIDLIPLQQWLRLSSAQEARLLASYIGPRGTGRTLRSGKNNKNAITLEPLTEAELDDLRASLPSHPDGEPAGWWSGDELRAFIDSADARLAAAPKPAPQLDLNRLSPEQLHRVAQCHTREQYEQVAQAILAEQKAKTA